MLRLLLVLCLLVALGALGIAHFKVKPAVEALRTELDETKTSLTAATTAREEAEKKEKEATARADKASRELTETKAALETAVAEATTQRSRADNLAAELSTTTKDKNDAQAKLARWEALGIQPDQIAKLQVDLKKTTEQFEGQVAENKELGKQIAFLKNRLLTYEHPNQEIEMVAGLKGTITAVGPARDFVFLDIGENQGVKERGKFMVRRGNKLVTKVKVVTVEPNRSIANVLPEWTQGDSPVEVGDVVLY